MNQARPVLRFYGGKWKLAPWIISHFPPHLSYVEPMCGSCSVLFRKKSVPLETVNDRDGRIVNFMRVLRDHSEELAWKAWATPWAQDEYDLSFESTDDPIEAARRFYIQMWMSYAGATNPILSTYGWRRRRRRVSPAIEFASVPDTLLIAAERLRSVQIENKDWQEVVELYDTEDTLFYVDPPYAHDGTERTKKDWYAHEFTEEDHRTLAFVLRQCQGYVVLSGYACPLYAELFEDHGWERHDRELSSNSGANRVESIWLSPRVVEYRSTQACQMSAF